MPLRVPKRRQISIAIGLGILAVSAAVYARVRNAEELRDSIRNYEVVYVAPKEWKALPHPPTMRFSYALENRDVRISGAVSRFEVDINPTMDTDAKSLVDDLVDATKDRMSDWEAKKIGYVDGVNTRFELVRRLQRNRSIVSAFAVKGNTTVLVTLATHSGQDALDQQIPKLRAFLETLRLEEQGTVENG